MTAPNPRQLVWKLTSDNIDQYKKPDCKYYEDCLDEAIRKDWIQFQCCHCNAYERNPNLAMDEGPLQELLIAIFNAPLEE